MTVDTEQRGKDLAQRFSLEEVLTAPTFDRRKDAFLKAMEAAWSDGWDACLEEMLSGSVALGILTPEQAEHARKMNERR